MNSIRNCKVCVVGGAGFLGSHLVEHLVRDRGCFVTVVDDFSSGHEKHLAGVKPGKECNLVRVDISTLNTIDWGIILRGSSSEYVFNYAAHPYIPECYASPAKFFNVNAAAVLNLLCAVEALPNIKGVLQVSSAELYGNANGRVDESYPIEPHSTYGVSKAAADGLVQVRCREAGIPVIALRQFNCVGERETHEYVIPEIISQLHHNGPFISLGNNSTRDFLYAGDAVRMAVELLEKGNFGEVYNLGSERAIRIYDLAREIGRLMGHDNINIGIDSKRIRPWEIWHLQSDNTKIYNVIGSLPEVKLQEALQRTIDYFHANGNKWDWANAK